MSTPMALKCISLSHRLFATPTGTSRPPLKEFPRQLSLIQGKQGNSGSVLYTGGPSLVAPSLPPRAMLGFSQETFPMASTTYKGMDCCLLEGGYSTRALFSHSFTGLSDRQWEGGPHGSLRASITDTVLHLLLGPGFTVSPPKSIVLRQIDTAQPVST